MASLRNQVAFVAVGALALSVAWVGPAHAEDARIEAQVHLTPEKLAPGETGRLAVHITVPEGWHLWSLYPGEGPRALQISVAAPLELIGDWHAPAPKVVFDRGFQKDLAQYGPGQIVIERAARVRPQAGAGSMSVDVVVKGQICSEDTCINQNVAAAVALEVTPEPTGAPDVTFTTAAIKPAGTLPTTADGVWSFLLFAFIAGLGALATPCVFPAIPLTVSFFSKFSQENFARGVRLAAFYALSMMAGFTFFGVLISILFGASGIQRLAAHPWFNVGLAAVLVFFSLNLLGMFEIRTPAFLLNFTNKLEGKYGPAVGPMKGAPKSGGMRDYIAVGVAAMTATTVFFTCTVAFVGVVVVAATEGDWFWPTLGMLAFSSAFVLPFFLLAVFPQAAQRLRGKHGSWLTVTRVTLGFVELAAATKFFSNADLVWNYNLLSRDLVLAFWIANFGLCALFLLGFMHLKEEGAPPPEPNQPLSVGRMLIGAMVISFSLYLAVGLFGDKPVGGWVDAWLPPPSSTSTQIAGAPSTGFDWIHDLESGRDAAEKSRELVFVNYTGYTCTNCRYMESSVFTQPAISSLLRSMTLIELYTDGMEERHERARQDQIDRFGTSALPFYAVETAAGEVIATFPSSTNDAEEFRAWLDAAIAKGQTMAAAVPAPLQPAAPAPAPAEAKGEPIVLRTTSLVTGQTAAATTAGKWTLINFWATWCSPCRQELEAFFVEVGAELEAQGGRFVTVAIEEDDAVKDASAYMSKIGVPDASALRLPADLGEGLVDPRLGFSGAVPHTVLISPDQRVVWKHTKALEESELRAVLTEHLGFAAR